MCAKQHTRTCVHVCASVEKAWPRLIATSYLVVTGLIKDDELTVGLSLRHTQRTHIHTHACACAHTHILYSFGRKIDRQPPAPHYGLFLEREENWRMVRGGRAGGIRKDEPFHFSSLLLRGQHGNRNWPECLSVWGTGCSTMGLFTPSPKVKRPK